MLKRIQKSLYNKIREAKLTSYLNFAKLTKEFVRPCYLHQYYEKVFYPVEKAKVNLEKLDNKGTIIFSPHYSEYDFAAIDLVMEREGYNFPFYLAKAELGDKVVLLGGIPITREEDFKKGYYVPKQITLKLLKEALKHGNVVIFPEGKRSDKPLRIKRGIIKIIEELGEKYNLYFLGFNKNYSNFEGFYLDDELNNEILIALEEYIIEFKI